MNNSDNLFSLFDENITINEVEFNKVLDDIRKSVMFQSREECLHIICEVLYTYGVDKGNLNKSAVDYMLCMYRDKVSDENLERIAVMCLYKNELNQREEEINNAHNENENGN